MVAAIAVGVGVAMVAHRMKKEREFNLRSFKPTTVQELAARCPPIVKRYPKSIFDRMQVGRYPQHTVDSGTIQELAARAPRDRARCGLLDRMMIDFASNERLASDAEAESPHMTEHDWRWLSMSASTVPVAAGHG